MDQEKYDVNAREIELRGGPPWGFRIGSATTTTAERDDAKGEDGGDEGMIVVGAVKIARVNPESKASTAGLRDGDLILSVNGERVEVPQSHPSTVASIQSGTGGGNSSSSQSPSQGQHHKILGQLQEDTVRLCVLSKKSKKVQKALAKGQFEQQQSLLSSGSYEKNPAASVHWADDKDSQQLSKDRQIEKIGMEADYAENEINGENTSSKSKTPTKSFTENGSMTQLARKHEPSQLGQDIPSSLSIPNGEPPSKSTSSSPNLLSDIIDELQLAATTTAKFLSDMEAHLQEEVSKMQSGPQGLLQQVSSSSTSTFAPNMPSSIPQPYPSSLLIKQEDLQQLKSKNENGLVEEILPVWSPPGVPPSPKLGKKFRPVTFNVNSVPSSPVLINQNGMSTPQSPGESALSPSSEPSVSVSHSFDNSLSKQFSNSQSSSTTTTGGSGLSNLPRYQNPTMVLLQKAREGHLPKGAAYLQQQPPSPSNIDPRISSSVNFNSCQPSRIINTPTAYGVNTHPPPPPAKPRPLKSTSSTDIINIPTTSKSMLSGEKEQRDWYKRMYESLHVEKRPASSAKCTYPAGRIKTGPPAKSFWAKRTHLNGTMSEPEDFDHPDEVEYDFNKFGSKVLSPGSSMGNGRPIPPGAIRFYNPGRIEDLNPAGGTCTSAVKKQRYHRQIQPDLKRHWALSSPKSSGYESDSNYIMRKRTETDLSGIQTPELPPMSPAEQKHMYAEIQKGGEVPLQGLRKFVPGPGPRDPMFEDLDGFRTTSPSQNIRYSESTVNIHYRAPVRIEEKEFVGEEELRKRQQQAMRAFYDEQRKLKFVKEIEDMERRRHSDNFVSSQKSPIPLNRYEDGDVIDGLIDNTPPRPGLWQRMTPEPMTPSMKNGTGTPLLAIARAKFNFTAQSLRELQLVKGDLILIRRKIDANWYEGELRQQGKNSYFYPNGGGSSALGIFPCSYVEILSNDPSSPATLAKYSSLSSNRPQDVEGLARVLFNFRPSHSFELDLVKGELVILSRRVDNNWFEGRKQRNPQLSGIFPISYVDVVKDIGAFNRSKSPALKKPVGQPVAHSLSYGAEMDDFSLNKHHYKPNEFTLQDDSDYGEVFSPIPNKNDRNARNRRRMNQRLELITIDTRLNNDQPFRYRSIYNYKPVHQDELELNEGDIIEVMEKCDDGWFVGTSQRTGLFGTFPGNYVERI